MADQENQNIEALEAESNEESMAYWCYQCNKEVPLEPNEEESEMVCSECRYGSVEAMAIAQRHAGVEIPADSCYVWRVSRLWYAPRVAQANTRREGGRSEGDDGLDSGHPHADSGDNQLDFSSRQVATEHNPANSDHNVLIDANAFRDDESLVLVAFASSEEDEEEDDANAFRDDESLVPVALASSGEDEEEDEDEEEEENDAREEVNAGDAREDQGEQRGNEEPDLNSDEDEEEEENDAWKEDAREEVNAGDAREDQGEQRGNEDPDLNSEVSNDAGERTPTSRRRDVLRQTVVSGGRLDWNEVRQRLEDNTIEVRVSIPEAITYVGNEARDEILPQNFAPPAEEDTYVGNPEDYVEEAGYEILLQNLAENDDTHRGAPPAAKSVIEGLPGVVICEDEIESGAALCAICKDVIPLGESGKKLPCQHLYHGYCIIPWLNSRNSCPICRYELPTDDADYEDQKKQRTMVRSTTTNPGMNSPAEGGLS